MNGREMKVLLAEAGIRAQKVIRKYDTGLYIADFYVPEMKTSVPSAQDWGKTITQAFPQATIIQADDMRADWREGRPIIAATVTFVFKTGDAS